MIPRPIRIETDPFYPRIVGNRGVEFLRFLVEELRQKFLAKPDVLLVQQWPAIFAILCALKSLIISRYAIKTGGMAASAEIIPHWKTFQLGDQNSKDGGPLSSVSIRVPPGPTAIPRNLKLRAVLM